MAEEKYTLTETEADIIMSMSENGMSVSAVADSLHFTNATVNRYLRHIHKNTGLNPRGFYDLIELVQMAKIVLKDTPTRNVETVAHARWINPNAGNATCSRCRIRQRGVYDDDNEQHYCGHCGAKMFIER